MSIVALPSDVLYVLCRLACDDPCVSKSARSYYRDVGRFRLVCREFRNIATSMSQLWTHIGDEMTVEYINILLARSGNLGLSVQLRLERVSCCVCPTWKVLIEHMCRWESLNVEIHDSEDWAHDCPEILSALHLPSLRSLDIDIYSGWNKEIEFRWNTPKLKSFTSRSSLDLNIPKFGSDLRCFKAVAIRPWGYAPRDALLNFLEKPETASLESPTLDFSEQLGLYDSSSFKKDPGRSPVPLTNLKSITADFGCVQGNWVDFAFLKKLDTPNLTWFRLRIGRDTARYRDYTWEWMAKVPILLPSLETFWVVFTGPLDEDDRIRICRKILACIPNQSAENTGETVVSGTMLVRRGGIEVNIVFEKGDPEDYADARSETFPLSRSQEE